MKKLSPFDSPFTEEYLREEIKFYGHPKPFKNDNLELRYFSPEGRCDDYFNVNWHLDPPKDVPMLIADQTLWMSLTWMEVQSMWVPILRAKGNAATVGLGLGYYALRVLDRVDHLDVYERNPHTIEWFRKTFADRLKDKVSFIEGDVFDTFKGGYDFLFNDRYSTIMSDNIIDDIEKFSSGAKEYRFWGQELACYLMFQNQIVEPDFYDEIIDGEERYLIRHWERSEGSQLKLVNGGGHYEFLERLEETMENNDMI